MADKKPDKSEGQVWQGHYPILHPDHADELETAAAVHEFTHGMPRADAEARAHEDYVRERALDASAHHLLGVRAASAGGNLEAAEQHGQAYAGAMRAAGHDPFSAPPPEVMNRMKDLGLKLYAFKPHAADAMFAPEHDEASPEDARIQALMGKLKGLRDRARSAATAETAETAGKGGESDDKPE